MHAIVKKLAAAGHLTAEQIDRVEKNAQAFIEQTRNSPGLRKEAELKLGDGGAESFGSILGRAWKPTLASMILGTGAVLGEQAVRSGYRAIKGALTKSRDYKEMLDNNPDLSGEDSSKVQRAFNTLHRFNPDMASDPLVAGSFVRSAVQFAQFPVSSVRDLISARKDMAAIGEPKLDLHRMVHIPDEKEETHPDQVKAWQAQATQAQAKVREHESRLAKEKEGQIEAE